jgi:hypothetical protein
MKPGKPGDFDRVDEVEMTGREDHLEPIVKCRLRKALGGAATAVGAGRRIELVSVPPRTPSIR